MLSMDHLRGSIELTGHLNIRKRRGGARSLYNGISALDSWNQ
ncbi:MAG: hypothetical protein ACYCWJ_04615 [Thermoplasmataceae archaeon]